MCSSEGKILDLHLKDMWSTVTRQEHPITRRPYFALHPCNTHKLMAPLLGAQGDRRSVWTGHYEALSWIRAELYGSFMDVKLLLLFLG